MKKMSLLVTACLISVVGFSQIQFGAKAGLNLANVSVSPKPSGVSYSFQPSFHIGGLVYIPLFSNFGLQPELLYSAQGSKLKYQGQTADDKLGYINIPVLFKYKDPSGFFAEIGPQLGILLSAKEKIGSSTSDFKSETQSTDVSGVLGIGYLSSINLGIDVRYNLGFTNIVKSSADGTAKNGVIQIGVFYVFGGSKK